MIKNKQNTFVNKVRIPKRKYGTCGVLIENSSKKILLQLRDKNVLFANCWGTFGGSIEKNETPLQAILRELKEELNYNTDITNIQYYGNFPYGGYDVHMFRIIDLSFDISNYPILEGVKAKFFSLEEVKSIKTAFHAKELVVDYYNRFHKTIK
ncbi:MAG: NUDIX domain-containing protein [Candidatus Woesearchaeota archaeon]